MARCEALPIPKKLPESDQKNCSEYPQETDKAKEPLLYSLMDEVVMSVVRLQGIKLRAFGRTF